MTGFIFPIKHALLIEHILRIEHDLSIKRVVSIGYAVFIGHTLLTNRPMLIEHALCTICGAVQQMAVVLEPSLLPRTLLSMRSKGTTRMRWILQIWI